MLKYTLFRVGQGVLGLLVVVTVVFGLARLSGDPATLMAPPQASADDVQAISETLGLDRPLLEQYGSYMLGLLRGDLGTSTSFSAPVTQLIGPALAETAILAVTALAFALVVGLPLGLVAGVRAGSKADLGVRIIALLGQSIPSFWLGLMLVLVFAVGLDLVPAFGSEGASSVILPAIALGAFPLAATARLTRSSVIEVMHKDFMMFAGTKGVSRPVLLKHVVRNASLPVVTLTGIQVGQLISGTIIVETLFAWPGLGQLAIQAINARDYQLIQGIVIVDTTIFVALLLLVDLSYGYLDPRVRTHDAATA